MTRQSRANEVNKRMLDNMLPKALREAWGRYWDKDERDDVLSSFSSFMDEVANQVCYSSLEESLGLETIR